MILACGVLQEYAQRGLGYRLTEKALLVIRELGYPLVMGIYASIYSQKIAFKSGFETVVRRSYEQHFPNYEKMPESMKHAHKEVLIMTKRFF